MHTGNADVTHSVPDPVSDGMNIGMGHAWVTEWVTP